jgi:aspartate aminotransferase-like enzyme
VVRAGVAGMGMEMFAETRVLANTVAGFKTPKGYWRNEPLTFDPDGGYALKSVWL